MNCHQIHFEHYLREMEAKRLKKKQQAEETKIAPIDSTLTEAMQLFISIYEWLKSDLFNPIDSTKQ